VEDTALYVYAPLGSRNEVGGDPGVPIEGAVERLHGLLAERAAVHPRSLNATNTHDTKRSADVRARLDALSEHSAAWERRLRHWRRRHRPLRTLVSGRLAPSHTTDNFIYQALVGIWPLRAASARAGEDDLVAMGKRLTAYIQKAVREAKVRTSWTDPDAEYEEAISRFIAALLDRGTSAPFIADVEQFASAIAPQATWNALARLVVHLTAPGVPDIYQGDELWFEALVDPDNRRPVDWEARERRLGEVDESSTANGVAEPAALEGWLRATADGRLKMYVTTQLLRFRRNSVAMMAGKTYAPLRITGQHADRVMAYRCAIGGEECIVVVPRLTCVFGAEPPVGPVWGDTSITNVGADAPTRWRCVLTGRESSVVGGALRVADLLGVLPVTVLHATS
jgi:(1->4)-alpha-D-glucan 1-alpha-D-glucosylmutase